MLEPRQIARFGALSVAVYLALMWVQPYVARPYAALFRSFGNAAFSRFLLQSEGVARFLDFKSPDLIGEVEAATGLQLRGRYAPPSPTQHKDTLMLLVHRGVRSPFGQMRTSSRLVGYEPTVVVLSLLLATRFPSAKRRYIGLALGLTLVHGFIFVRLALNLLVGGFASAKPYALFHPSAFWLRAIDRADDILMQDPTACWMFPVFIWLLVVLLTGAFTAFRPSTPSGDRA